MVILAAAQPYSHPARPELTGGVSCGVLLSHGFTGSPASMRPWGEYLAAKGYAVEVPRLPGHGTSWQEMNQTTWADWYAEITRTFDLLRAEHARVAVCGLSMGGGLVLQLAADRVGEVDAVVLVNPAVTSANKQLRAVPVLKHLVPSMSGVGSDIKKPGFTELAYSRVPLRALHSMMRSWRGIRNDLTKVTAPVLLFRSSVDNVVDPTSHKLVMSTVSSPDKELRILDNSYHVATMDNDADRIFAESEEFIAQRTYEAT